ncbi:hypothetical protein C8Q75DRAFT_753678 [Abortiporus biennis]|nr:hypothetical protein C8Q75DRAFT_753678 [Abortiporus biennis]
MRMGWATEFTPSMESTDIETDMTRDRLPNDSYAWGICADRLKKRDDMAIQSWKDEIDSLLVFGGLFSAVLTAFIVESYKQLQTDSGDLTVELLQQILGHLANNPNPPSTSPVTQIVRANSSSVRVNSLWFSSLVCSLGSAAVGILVKQWLRAAETPVYGPPRHIARIYQFRHDNLISWKVPEILALLPTLLQLALVLFFVGLVDLLWSLNTVVAGIASSLVIIFITTLLVTPAIPVFRADCPYVSPMTSIFLPGFLHTILDSRRTLQSRSFFVRRRFFSSFNLSSTIQSLYGVVTAALFLLRRGSTSTVPYLNDRENRLHSFTFSYGDNWSGSQLLYEYRAWQGHELRYVDEQTTSLDIRILTEYASQSDAGQLEVVRSCCLDLDHDICETIIFTVASDHPHLTQLDKRGSNDRARAILCWMVADLLEKRRIEDPFAMTASHSESTCQLLAVVESLHQSMSPFASRRDRLLINQSVFQCCTLTLAGRNRVASRLAIRLLWGIYEEYPSVASVPGLQWLIGYLLPPNEPDIFFRGTTMAFIFLNSLSQPPKYILNLIGKVLDHLKETLSKGTLDSKLMTFFGERLLNSMLLIAKRFEGLVSPDLILEVYHALVVPAKRSNGSMVSLLLQSQGFL